jgi:hypothetical protein
LNLISELDTHGFMMVHRALDAVSCAAIAKILGITKGAGSRDMLRMPEVSAISQSILSEIVRPFFDCQPLPVRGIYFDKRPESNWLVSWHQDLTLAVKERVDMEGFGPWSVKDGITHVQPPIDLLEKMVTVRLHLDDADSLNGALRVLPKTHRKGRLNAESIQTLRAEEEDFVCEAAAGDVLLMRPLLLHASSRSTCLRSRRVLHIEYAGFNLPAPLEWHESPCQNLFTHYR